MSQNASWLVLIVAGVLEVCWAVGLKYTDGFTRLWPTVGTAVALVASIGLIVAGIVGLKLATPT